MEVPLELAHRLEFIKATDYARVQTDVETIGRMLYRLLSRCNPGNVTSLAPSAYRPAPRYFAWHCSHAT